MKFKSILERCAQWMKSSTFASSFFYCRPTFFAHSFASPKFWCWFYKLTKNWFCKLVLVLHCKHRKWRWQWYCSEWTHFIALHGKKLVTKIIKSLPKILNYFLIMHRILWSRKKTTLSDMAIKNRWISAPINCSIVSILEKFRFKKKEVEFKFKFANEQIMNSLLTATKPGSIELKRAKKKNERNSSWEH